MISWRLLHFLECQGAPPPLEVEQAALYTPKCYLFNSTIYFVHDYAGQEFDQDSLGK